MMKTNKLSFNTMVSYFRSKPLRIVFIVLWIIFVYLIIAAGFRPDPYLLKVRNIPPPHPYPIVLVLILLGSMVLHLSLLVAVDIYRRSRWKLLTMLMVTAPFLLVFGIMGMHAPPPMTAMIRWLFLSMILFLLLCVWQCGAYFYNRFYNKSSNR